MRRLLLNTGSDPKFHLGRAAQKRVAGCPLGVPLEVLLELMGLSSSRMRPHVSKKLVTGMRRRGYSAARH